MKTLNETILDNISPFGDYLRNVRHPLKLLFLGEIKKPSGESDYFKYIKQDIEDADLVFCQYKYYDNDCDAFVKYLRENGVRYAFLADKHAYDNGLDTLKSTVNTLYNNDLWHSGVYRDDIDRQKHTPSIVRIRDFRIGLMSYTEELVDNKFEDSNVNIFIGPDGTLREKMLTENIKQLKDQDVDMIICNICFKNEYTFATTKRQKHIVDFLFKNGVAIVIGQGAHYVQKVEFNPQNDVYDNDTLVAYSLGNCLSNPHMDEYCDADGGIMLHVDIDTGRKQVDNASYKIVWCAKSIYESDDAYYTIPIKSQNVIKKDSDKFGNFITNAHNQALNNNVNVSEEI